MKAGLGFLVFTLLSFYFSGCSSQQPAPRIAQRLPASADECPSFNKLSAAEKLKTFMDRHGATAINPGQDQLILDTEAMVATGKFLSPAVPGAHESLGHGALDHTLILTCDTLPPPQHAKMVHALGTLAKAHLLLYPKAKKLNPSGVMIDEVDSPWTGLLDASKNEGSVPLLIRFSIANPLLAIAGKSLPLEFIPGLGLKFLIDGQKSIDLLAMESLAGQGIDHDYFKYEFSPDFSAHAPPGFNTALDGDEKTEINERYDYNPLNKTVMGWVGDRFFESMKTVYGLKDDQVDRHSPAGPNPFIISLQGLARVDKKGNTYSAQKQKRPWRLVLKPALDNIEAQRLDQIKDSTPFSAFHHETDFREKLSHLQSGDRVFYVLAETQAGKRYAVGEIVLDSSPFPSKFADREFFLQHEIDFDRSNGSGSIVEP
jgi:hypothetical protein